MTKRESRLYFRELRRNIRPHLTNNYKKMHGGTMLRSSTMFEFMKKRKIYKRVYRRRSREE